MEHMPQVIRKTSPYLRRPQAKVSRMMSDVVIALIPVIIFAIYSFGWSAVWILLASTLSMTLTEAIYYWITSPKGETAFTLSNYSAVVSGLIFGLTLADNTPIWVVVITGVLGILMAKLFFGGLGQNIFNPAALARVLVAVNFATLSTYQANIPIIDGEAGATVLQTLNESGNLFNADILNHIPLWQLFTGIGVPGSLGEVSALLIIVGGLYLALRHSFEVRIPVVFIATVFGLASAVAVYQGLGIWYPLMHVFSGGVMFGAVFMATDPITSPITKPGRIYFAFALGFVTFIIRLFGALPEGVVFSILIMNMFVSAFDYFKWSNPRFTTKGSVIFAGVVVAAIAVVLVGVSYVG
ncbi:RnfABCDGE type electron transport complex subunit D [Candidatus Xianfuyuplasma coldseepsis]|uniref:RnfABCDGE type electron transport complex subunit D n=1 Tax=Candidatus Xianfuyuplasma coldseepsis TaxID=2782163 RepID=A0A7L7KNN6_9MOLU|nr:RnfABCDGE type electron transport complex subunit D [Xianfuyuplasma coldseepsis]QMS84283.1 RnfABCDGE type electron transport complex subunit D [Xianfuyuplasma coldseepsis]